MLDASLRYARTILRMVVLMLVVGPAACGILGLDDRDPRAVALDRLEEARDRWEAASIADYEYLYRIVLSEGHPDWQRQFLVRVEGGEVVEIADPDAAAEPPPDDEAPGGPPPEGYTAATVPELFEVAEDAIERADQFDVAYDPDLGYPTRISVDFSIEIADDEFETTVEALTPLSQ